MARLFDRDSLGASPVPQSRRGVAANPAAGAIGQAVEGVGERVANIGQAMLERQDRTQYALAGTSLLKASNEAQAALQDDPDPATAQERYREQMKRAQAEAAGMIGNHADRGAFEAQAGQDIERGAAQVGLFAKKRLDTAEINAVEELTDTNRTLAVNASTPQDREQAIMMTGAAWDGLVKKGLVDPAIAQGKKREFVNRTRYDIVDRMRAAGEIDQATKTLQAFAPEMDEADVTRAAENIRVRQMGMDAEQRRIASEARAEEAHARAMQKDQLGAVEQTLNAGGGTVQDMAALAQKYAELGDQSKAAEWALKATEFAAVQGSRDFNLPQMDARIAELTAKQNGKGLTGGEAAELNGLKDQRTQSASRLGQGGGALLQLQYATGKPLTPIDLSNPASLVRRATEATAAAQRYGRAAVEPLLPEEIKPLQDLMASGDSAKKLQALRIIAGFGKPAAIMGAAHQISGDGDGAFRIAATLINNPVGPQVSLAMLRGDDALKANPKVWDEKEAREIYKEYVGSALKGAPAEFAADVYAGAKAYYAAKVTQAGGTDWNEDAFRRAIDTSLGHYQEGQDYKGGTALFSGQRVVIPQGWTAEGVFRRFARASSGDWAHAAGGLTPAWPDGSTVYTAQLRQLVPEWRGGTVYAFRSPTTGRVMQAREGGDYTVDAAKVPWH